MAFSTQNFGVGGCLSMSYVHQYFISFHYRIPFCSMDMPRFVYPFSCLWTFAIFQFWVIMNKAYINILL